MSVTARFLGDPVTWVDARLQLDDWHGLWGGRVLFLSGRGQVVVQRAPAPQHETCHRWRIPADEAHALLALAVHHDVLAFAAPARPRVPDEAPTRLTLRNAQGEQRAVVKLSGDRHAGLEAFYAAVLELERRAQATDPIYTGPFRHTFQPEWD